MKGRALGLWLLMWMVVAFCVLESPNAWGQGCDDLSPGCEGGEGPGEDSHTGPPDGTSGGGTHRMTAEEAAAYDAMMNAQQQALQACWAVGEPLGDQVGMSAGPDLGVSFDGYSFPDTSPTGVASAWQPPTAQGNALGVLDDPRSVEPANDPGSERAGADPVALRNGEFVHRTVDLEVLGGQLPFRLARSYRSRVNFEANLGPSWDHSFNLRVFENVNDSICASEIAVSLGNLISVRMRPDAEPPNLGFYYPVENNGWKVERNSGSCHWKLFLPTGVVHCFDDDGYVTSTEALDGERLEFLWDRNYTAGWCHTVTSNLDNLGTGSGCGKRPQTKICEGRLSSVKRVLAGQNTHEMRFHYDNSDELFQLTRASLVALQKEEETEETSERVLAEVTYSYDFAGRLERVSDTAGESREVYEYEPVRYSSGAPLKGLESYCDSVCAWDAPNHCGPSFCKQLEDIFLEEEEWVLEVSEMSMDERGEIKCEKYDSRDTMCHKACTRSCSDGCEAAMQSDLVEMPQNCVDEFGFDSCWGIVRGSCSGACMGEYYNSELLPDPNSPGCRGRCATPGVVRAACVGNCKQDCMDAATPSYVYGLPRYVSAG